MLERFAQEQPPPTPTPAPAQPPRVDVHLDLSGLASLIWQAFIDHLGDVGAAIWAGLKDHLGEIAQTLWTPLSAWLVDGLRESAQATWDGIFGAVPLLLSQLPADLTYNLPAYRAIATDPVPVAVGGATLAIVLLGLRTLLGSMVGRDHVITHVTGRLIPATFLALAYPILVVRGIGLLNNAAAAVGARTLTSLVTFPDLSSPQLLLMYLFLWLLLIFFAVRLLIRTGYGLFRFLVALVFGPVAIILWAIPQTEWVTSVWLHELIGWGITPLLVVVCLALAIPLAAGQAGFLGAFVFGIAGLQAAHDLVGLLSLTRGGGGHALDPIGYARMAARAAIAAGSGGAGVAAASIPANRLTTLADMYGFQ